MVPDQSIILNPIGVVHSPYKEKKEAPHQGRNKMDESIIEIFPEYVEALEGLERDRFIFIIYYFDRAEAPLLKVVPHGRKEERGIFSTRAPPRPNPLGLTLVELVDVENNMIRVKGLEALDGSPVLDIKPYIEDLDGSD